MDFKEIKFPAIFWVILTSGILLFIIGHFCNWTAHEEIKEGVLGLSHVMLSSGVFTIILKSMQFMGLFKTELVDVIYDVKFLSKRNDLAEIWEKVSTALFKNKFPKISKEITKDVRGLYFPTNHVHYYENFDQTLELEFIDDEPDMIKVIQTSSFTVYPTDKNVKIDHTSTNIVQYLDSPDECILNVDLYKVNGKDESPKVVKSTDTAGKKVITTIDLDLNGHESYKFETKITKKYNFKVDNFIGVKKDYLIHNFNLKVILKDKMQLTFINAGTLNPFTEKNYQNGSVYDFVYKGLIYPKQGYVLIIGKL